MPKGRCWFSKQMKPIYKLMLLSSAYTRNWIALFRLNYNIPLYRKWGRSIEFSTHPLFWNNKITWGSPVSYNHTPCFFQSSQMRMEFYSSSEDCIYEYICMDHNIILLSTVLGTVHARTFLTENLLFPSIDTKQFWSIQWRQSELTVWKQRDRWRLKWKSNMAESQFLLRRFLISFNDPPIRW